MRVVQHALSGVVGVVGVEVVVGVVVVEGDEGGGVIEWVIVGGWFVFARSRKVRFPRGFFWCNGTTSIPRAKRELDYIVGIEQSDRCVI